MTLQELVRELEAVLKVHPESKDADVRASNDRGDVVYISYLQYKKKTKHNAAVLWLTE